MNTRPVAKGYSCNTCKWVIPQAEWDAHGICEMCREEGKISVRSTEEHDAQFYPWYYRGIVLRGITPWVVWGDSVCP